MMKSWLLGGCCLTLLACGNKNNEPDTLVTEPLTTISESIADSNWQGLGDDLLDRLASLESQLHELSIDQGCNQDSQCQPLAMGNKACGGPTHYLAANDQHPEWPLAQLLSLEHQQLAAAINQASGAISDCSLVNEPSLSCQQQRCQSGPAAW